MLLRAQPIGPRDPGWQQFPKTVAEAMDQYLASVGDQAGQDQVEDLLRALAYARGDGLPLDKAGLWPRLATALARPGRSYTADHVDRLLDTAADYLIETVITGQAAYYRLYHQALSDRLRERDQQHPRPVSAAQTTYQCLLGTVARYPEGARNWPPAHPYLHSQLAGYAADADQLIGLLDDPGFLVAADPAGLFAALQRPGQPPSGNAQIYRHAYPDLRPGADAAGERAGYLQLAARRHDAPLADQLGQLPLRQPWAARWSAAHGPTPTISLGATTTRCSRWRWASDAAGRSSSPAARPDGAGVGPGVGRAGAGPLTGDNGVVTRWRWATARPAGRHLRQLRPDGAGVGPGVGRTGARPAHGHTGDVSAVAMDDRHGGR